MLATSAFAACDNKHDTTLTVGQLVSHIVAGLAEQIDVARKLLDGGESPGHIETIFGVGLGVQVDLVR